MRLSYQSILMFHYAMLTRFNTSFVSNDDGNRISRRKWSVLWNKLHIDVVVVADIPWKKTVEYRILRSETNDADSTCALGCLEVPLFFLCDELMQYININKGSR